MGKEWVEVCPNCGDFAQLVLHTGWCRVCTKESHPVCNRCGTRTSYGDLCRSCKRLEWLERNADRIETYMMQGLRVKNAIALIIQESRAVCLCCDDLIIRGTPGRHFFCNAKPRCRSVRRRYKYLIYEKGYSKEYALYTVLQQEDE